MKWDKGVYIITALHFRRGYDSANVPHCRRSQVIISDPRVFQSISTPDYLLVCPLACSVIWNSFYMARQTSYLGSLCYWILQLHFTVSET